MSGLVNVFTMVLPLVRWWWWYCCLFLPLAVVVLPVVVPPVAVVVPPVTIVVPPVALLPLAIVVVVPPVAVVMSPASQDAKVDLKALIVAVMPIYCLSETINLFFFLFLCVFNKLIIISVS